jgi:hypothetical protein
VEFAMFGISNEEDFQRFHRENLMKIAEINTEFGLNGGNGGFLAKRRAGRVLQRAVNREAGKHGLRYNLQGHFMNTGTHAFEYDEKVRPIKGRASRR